MIIDKVQPFWTPEEEDRLQEVIKAEHALIDSLERKKTDNTARPALMFDDKQLAEWRELDAEAKAIRNGVEDRYIASFSRNPKGVYKDIEEIVGAIEKEDFIARVREQIAQLASITKDLRDVYGEKLEESNPNIAILRDLAKENYTNCYDFILFHLRVQLNAIDRYKLDLDKATAIIEKRVALWYVKPQPTYFAMAHGKATDALAFMSSKNAEVNPVTKTATINKFGVQLAILKFEELHATLGISTDKLLSTAIATFTQHNDFRHSKEPDRKVTIPLREYAQLLGYDVEEHETSTPEEAEAEKKRAKAQLDNARKAVKKDLLTLQASTLRWEEPIKGKPKDFDSISLVTRVAIKNGEIQIYFTPEIAQYLAEKNLITQYPTKLLRISGRKPTAYYIGRKLAEHYNIDNNQIRGTHDRISIKALLPVTDLATYEEVQKKDRGHWVERIKEPLEQALDELTREGILTDWKYTHARGVDLTEEEASNLTSYSDFEKLYLHFTPADKIDHTDRIKAKKERQPKKASKKKKKS